MQKKDIKSNYFIWQFLDSQGGLKKLQ